MPDQTPNPDPRIQTDADRAVVGRTADLAVAFAASGIAADVWYDEDGDEGWHITIEAGEEEYVREGGMQRSVILAYWTRDDTWYWSDVVDGRSTTYRARDLSHGAGESSDAIVIAVRQRVETVDA